MTLWGQNGHRVGQNEALDDATVELLLAGRYDGDAPDLVAVRQFLEKVRSLAERPVPAPSDALAAMLSDSVSSSSGDEPAESRPWIRALPVGPVARPTEDRRVSAGPDHSGRVRMAALAGAVSAVLIAMLLGAGSTRLLPGPTQDVVAKILRTVTPFDVPEHHEPETVSSRTNGSGTIPTENPDTGDRGAHPTSTGRAGANRGPAVGGGSADNRSQPRGVDAAPTPTATLTPGTLPTTPPPPPEPYVFSIELNGSSVTQTMGDPDGRGTAVLESRPGTDDLCLTIEVTDIALITAAHLHAGSIGESGPVVVTFVDPTSGTPATCVTVDDQLATQIRTGPENHYVDVHTTEFPNEALRGQVT